MKLQLFLHSSSKFMAAAVMSLSLLCASAVMAVESETTRNPAAAGDGVAVGMAKRDGITVTGNEAFITRNGVTEKLIKELKLPSGVIARPDGTMVLPDQTDATLRSTQILTLDGKVMDIPVDPAVNNPPTPPQVQTGGVNGTRSAGNQAVSGGGTNNGAPMRERNDNNSGGGGGTAYVGGGGGYVEDQLPATFVTSDGQQFSGVINPDGSISTSDGRSVVNDGSLRVMSQDANGRQMPGPLSRNGQVTRSDGSTISPDGTVRSSDGRVISTRESRRQGMNADGSRSGNTGSNNANGNFDSTSTDTNNPNARNQMRGFRVPGGNQEASGNSPNNAGTVNVDNKRTGTSSPNNSGTTNFNQDRTDSDAATNSPNNGGTTNKGNASPNRGSEANGGSLNNQAAPNAERGQGAGVAPQGGSGSGNGNGFNSSNGGSGGSGSGSRGTSGGSSGGSSGAFSSGSGGGGAPGGAGGAAK